MNTGYEPGHQPRGSVLTNVDSGKRVVLSIEDCIVGSCIAQLQFPCLVVKDPRDTGYVRKEEDSLGPFSINVPK